eukprot:TRINITY_DN18332_c1_g2_i1.p1 TRINITY_DN18332_c1_g2~~TRINITY_DN18332_c1_g2_i1.p1  ORF type:complete len:265 (-),score=46.57 TRINITY_DN18332_c1_g2_i1:84-827(-)
MSFAVAARSLCRSLRNRGSAAQLQQHGISKRGIFDTREYYDRVFGELGDGEILEWYNLDWEELGPQLSALIAPDESAQPPRRLLDLGCGTSRLASQLALEPRLLGTRLIVGADISPAAVAVQREATQRRYSRALSNPRMIFAVEDAVAGLSFRSGLFDVVLEKGFFDALLSTRRGAERLPSALKEAWRVLRGGGLLISASQSGQLIDGGKHFRDMFLEAGLHPAPSSVKEVARLPQQGIHCFAVRKP